MIKVLAEKVKPVEITNKDGSKTILYKVTIDSGEDYGTLYTSLEVKKGQSVNVGLSVRDGRVNAKIMSVVA